MHVGIIGTGDVGRALARGLTAAGHDVVVGSRTPEDAEIDGDVTVGSHADAVAADAVILAVPPAAAVDLAGSYADRLTDSVVIDPTNEYPTATEERSVAERIAGAGPEAAVVKAFNTIGAEHMPSPEVDGEPATMFVAGDDPEARETVAALAADLGFEPVAAGDLGAARHLEHLARFWIHLSLERHRDIAFRLLGA